MLETKEFDTDVLIVGGGGAGAVAAIRAASLDSRVLVVTKGPFPSGNTSLAMAGYSAALGYADPRDNPDVHFDDIMRTGKGLNNPNVVRARTKEIVMVTKELDSWGIDFVREDGKLAQKPAPAWHTYSRIVHQGFNTGKAVTKCLREKTRQMDIKNLEYTVIGGLLKDDKRIAGAWGFDFKTGEFILIRTKAVVMATGGMGHLFPNTDNVDQITGEGYALAYNAGAELVDMEMAHFNIAPCYPEGMRASIAVSGIIRDFINEGGAKLYNNQEERFMIKDYPDTGEKGRTGMELARAVGREICEERGTIHGGVYLDLSDITEDMKKDIFSKAWKRFSANGIDLNTERLEVAPYPHDFLGGIKIDGKGRTSIEGLFAAGEAAGGSHGADRPGGAALSDALAFGSIAGKNAADYSANLKKELSPEESPAEENKLALESILSGKEGKTPEEIQKAIQLIAHRYINIERNDKGLRKAIEELEQIKNKELPRMCVPGEDTPENSKNLRKSIELKGQLVLARLIAEAALCRQESRGGDFGGHYRSDYPLQDDENWLKNIVLKDKDGEISCDIVAIVEEG